MIHDTGDRQVPDSRTLAASLVPLLVEACQGRLSEVTWFKADWQRGGAATGRATFALPEGGEARVMVKLPVVQRELLWTHRLQRPIDGTQVVPKLYASGQSLRDYDLAWLVTEWIPHGPLGTHWHEDHTVRMAAAAARFYAACSHFPVDRDKRVEPWDNLLRDAQKSIRINAIPQEQRWRAAVKSLRGRLEGIVAQWEARDAAQWLHGDLHFANAMSRISLETGPVCLIDLAEVHPGHWVEDAVYLERQLWSSPQRLRVHNPVQEIAAARKAQGLPADEDYPKLAMIRRALLAGTAPRFLKTEGSPRHLAACLERLERALKELK